MEAIYIETMMITQDYYQRAIVFATLKHLDKNQTIPNSNLPYVVHLSNVAMEILMASKYTIDFDSDFAVQLSLLHDTLEDTETTFEELELEFGIEIANGVLALTKNKNLPKEDRMLDCLDRIVLLKKEVWAVKLADRITNLQKPPSSWTKDKKSNYLEEAKMILEKLKSGNEYLENRLKVKTANYEQYIS